MLIQQPPHPPHRPTSVTGQGLLQQWVCSAALSFHPGPGPSSQWLVAGGRGVTVHARECRGRVVGSDILGKTIKRVNKSQGMLEGAPVGEKHDWNRVEVK